MASCGRRALPLESKVCIIGAGAAGLYIGMILDDLAIPGLRYEILEASNRVGGRIYTHRFSEAPQDYYDVGAMRFPQQDSMARVFDLFRRLRLTQAPFYHDDDSGVVPSRYNDVVATQAELLNGGFDIYKVSQSNGGSIPDETVRGGVASVLAKALDPHKAATREDGARGFKALMRDDRYSLREYLQEHMASRLDYFSIQWMEKHHTWTSLFEQSFSESVIDDMHFNPLDPTGRQVEWVRIEGGSGLMTDRMHEILKGSVTLNARVRRISIDQNTKNEANIRVECFRDTFPSDNYVTVFNTTTLPCLQRIGLRGFDLHPSQKDALRCLHYEDSAKVAMKFKYAWWEKECGIFKGVASTDLPIRQVVYPSYNTCPPGTAILICSYTWGEDARRMGALISRDSPNNEDELRELVFDDLAKLHERSFVNKTLDDIRVLIAEAYITHHAFSWGNDSCTTGGAAMFSAGQYENLYPFLTRPIADGKFHIVGEASSMQHSWVVGALESAYCAVARFLIRFQLWESLDKLKANWGTVDDFDMGPTTNGV